jgi:hypothetical protein
LRNEVDEALIDTVEVMAICIKKLTRELMLYESGEDIASHIPELADADGRMKGLYGEKTT